MTDMRKVMHRVHRIQQTLQDVETARLDDACARQGAAVAWLHELTCAAESARLQVGTAQTGSDLLTWHAYAENLAVTKQLALASLETLALEVETTRLRLQEIHREERRWQRGANRLDQSAQAAQTRRWQREADEAATLRNVEGEG